MCEALSNLVNFWVRVPSFDVSFRSRFVFAVRRSRVHVRVFKCLLYYLSFFFMVNRHFTPTLPPMPSGEGRRRSIGASPSTTPSSPPSRKALGGGGGEPPRRGAWEFARCYLILTYLISAPTHIIFSKHIISNLFISSHSISRHYNFPMLRWLCLE